MVMQRVASFSALEEGRPVTVEIGETKILLVRRGSGVQALAAECPHAGAPLDQGAVCGDRLICPWHKATFDLGDGGLLEPPALEGLRCYPVRLDEDDVVVSPEPLQRTTGAIAPHAGNTDDRVMVIVGAGAAGAAGAAALREFGFVGRVVLVGEEPGEPFDRTALSKFVLEGGMQPEEVPPLRPDGFWEAHRIDRVRDRVVSVDAVARAIVLETGGSLAYSAVMLAPGGAPRPLQVPGGEAALLLRSQADARRILDALQRLAGPDGALTDRLRVVVVGGGFIGLEAASALRQQGVGVDVVLTQDVPLQQALGLEVGMMLRRLHETNGVRFHVGRVASIETEDGVTRAVRLEDGTRLEAALVLAGTGIRPATGFAASLHPAEDGGLETDAGMRVADGVYAAGDAARFPFGTSRIRVEHWRVAQQHARVAARNMLGDQARFEQPPFFWTYHYGKRIEVHGHPESVDRTVIEGDLEAQDFVARQYRGDRLVGLIGCQRDTELAALSVQVPALP